MNENRFWQDNMELVEYLNQVLKKHRDNREDIEWKKPRVWMPIIKNIQNNFDYYKRNDDILNYAQVQIGLARYLSFYYYDWMSDSEKNTVVNFFSRIITSALKITLPSIKSGKCGKHEDKACILGTLGRRMPCQDISRIGWPTIPKNDATSFASSPSNIILKPGDELVRVISKQNNPYGPWWMKRQNLPQTKTKWRSGFAVLRSWNTDNYYASFIVDRKLNAWQGKVASQKIPNRTCILEGGLQQIWIEPSHLKNYLLKHEILKNLRPSF